MAANTKIMSPGSPPSRRCFLLEAPPEIRLHIYEIVLSPSTISLRSYDNEDPTSSTCKDPETATTTTGYYHYFPPQEPSEHLQPAILRTCRQIYQEASGILHQPQKLSIGLSLPGDIGKNGDRAFDVVNLQRARRVRRLSISLVVCSETYQEDLRHHQFIAEYIPRDVVLESLELLVFASGLWEFEKPSNVVFDTIHEMTRLWSAAVRCSSVTVKLLGPTCDFSDDCLGWTSLNRAAWTEFRDTAPILNQGMYRRGLRS
ncbi:hypothetical protein Tdes44962_MAKER06490 [Teratosphaeria destructans]|uniref:DUF7730 domain-containing protein n=1 Tax=Teratosphaeria destructans TaxID=418781 RepID=A0A9W7T1H9_9PEZI|nr:hypothetical protein Tdes44962_MAKER06490 [Teratosphaeria destructans]